MASLEELPAFSMWKMFCETIPVLLKIEANQDGFTRLANIVKSKDIFVYNRDPSVSFLRCQATADKYRAFTTWLLGRFFYVLACDKFSRIHSVIIEAQICILHQLEKTQSQVHREMVGEYGKALKILSENCNEAVSLDVFVPHPIELGLDLSPVSIQIPKRHVAEFSVKFVRLYKAIVTTQHAICTQDNLNCLAVLLSEGSYKLKLEILDLYNKIQLYDKVEFEIVAHEVFSGKAGLNDAEYEFLQNILIEHLRNKPNAALSLFLSKQNIGKDLANLCQVSNDFTRDIPEAIRKFSRENPTTSWIDIQNLSLDWAAHSKTIFEPLCGAECHLEASLHSFLKTARTILRIKKDARHELSFFNEGPTLLAFLKLANAHLKSCRQQHKTDKAHQDLLYGALVAFPFVFGGKNATFAFRILTQCKRYDFVGGVETEAFRKETEALHDGLAKAGWSGEGYFVQFMSNVTGGLFELGDDQVEEIETALFKMCQSRDERQIGLVIDSLPYALMFVLRQEQLMTNVLRFYGDSNDPEIQKRMVKTLSTLLCMCSSEFVRVTTGDDEDDAKVSTVCLKCHKNRQQHDGMLRRKFAKVHLDLTPYIALILKDFMKYMSQERNAALKIETLRALPSCASHIVKFHSPVVAKLWCGAVGDRDAGIRREYGRVLPRLLDNEVVASEVRNQVLDVVVEALMANAKKALKESNYELQETLLETVNGIKDRSKEAVKVLVYFIMVPTSKYWFLAINMFLNIPNVYKQYRQEICESIVHLSAVNQALFEYPLSKSLDKISVTLQFFNYKDFVQRECQHLLPHFVAKLIRMPEVAALIEQVAVISDAELGELLASKYGYIFLHVFLSETKDDFRLCMTYLEKTTGLTGPVLRKRNFRVILNELVVNFHEKRDKVLLALHQLSREETEGNRATTVQDYLQRHFLGLLQHFDSKLAKNSHKKKDLVLASLADLFRYMGPKHMTPLRFKIIAMLRTIDCSDLPDHLAEVWDAFVRSCEVEALGPQLATIFASLKAIASDKTQAIVKYLLVENEATLKEHFCDLFFVHHETLAKYATRKTLKETIQSQLKYLKQETMEVRVLSLRHLRQTMAKNREELDKMILGYDGIDPVIVDLIDSLMLGCREKDEELKLACGEVVGELGAVEPSHLPRRYAHSAFTFYLDDDTFIANAINELTKAFQGEKNTHNVDRFALAIQEILKDYGVSPAEGSPRRHLWSEFSEAQQELMLPLLSSKYIIKQAALSSSSGFPCPIYGTSVGASFQSWLYNWTCTLIASLPQERHRTLLALCLPAMKQDQKILMTFLPHVLTHCLMEDAGSVAENAHAEIRAVTTSKSLRVDGEALHVRPFPSPNMPATLETITPEEVKQTQCTKVVFVLLDFLDRWLREWQWDQGLGGRNNDKYRRIKSFLNRFCKLHLAKCNYQCGEYPRALMYLEDHITDHPDQLPQQLSFQAEIYAQLDEPDGVAGVTALRQAEPSVEQRILALEVSGKLSDAASCYERMAQPLKLHHVRGLVQCYLDLDNVNTALNFARGALDQHVEFGNMLLEMQAEPLWRLGRYDELAELLDKPGMQSWGCQVGRALHHFGSGNRDGFVKVLRELRRQQVDFLGAASLEEGSYQHGYCYISKLHALNELEQVEKATQEMLLRANNSDYVDSVVEQLSKEWELRIKVVQESVRVVEPLLCLRRVALEQSKKRLGRDVPRLDSLLGECWLLSAKTSRAAGVHQQAYTYNLKAEEFAPPRLFLEKAELHWLREEHEQALTTLRRGIETMLPPSAAGKEALGALPQAHKKLCAEAKLLIASYNDAISNVDTDVMMLNYKEAVEVYKEWEKSFVCLAQFYDRIYQGFVDDDCDANKGSDIQIHMINCFGKSLLYGTSYVYQSMPRLLSIWFDYGTRLLNVTSASAREERKNNLLKMTKLIDSFLDRLPSFIFLTAFSQLVSRICHPQREVYMELKSIIIKLLLQYPQHSLWMIISVIKSSYAIRAKRCAEILNDPKLKTQAMSKLVRDFTNLAEKLIELCNKEVAPDATTTTVSTLIRALPRMLGKGDFSEIMIPTHNFRKLILPNPDFSSTQHNPFPSHHVYIVGIEEEVTILPSLQRPRRITLRGSDGKGYMQLLKPKDDLRKDFRLMEFNDIMNQLLSCEAEARQRRLYIRLYSVAPLNEECGLIEWVPNLVTLRKTVMELYKQKGVGMKTKELKEASCNIRDPLAKKRDVFNKLLLPKHPPVLAEWFRKTFPDAQSWLIARTAYIRTTAVISMVGYILGLGDRHGENILLDSVCGDTVHVDFNCLFNKGETFEWPEKVPFRLTQNMVSAMGPLGVEGAFRKSCACTLKVLRDNTNTLMSVVTPFVYDPLLSWPKNVPSTSHSNLQAEKTNEKAMDHIKDIRTRLSGIVKTKVRLSSIPLSVDGQTNNLILEAMSVDNLCQMYIGWGPYM